jgi:hypothetical protein
MVEEAARDPTVQEIVVALRETTLGGKRRGVSVVAERSAEGDHAVRQRWLPADQRSERGYSEPAPARRSDSARVDVAALRDAEMQRLLDDNARLNQRVVELLKIIEEQAARQHEGRKASRAADAERAAVAAEVRSAIESQLKPVLLTVLQVLKHPPSNAAPRVAAARSAPADGATAWRASPEPIPTPSIVYREPALRGAEERHQTIRSASPEAGYYPGWIADLIRTVGGEAMSPGGGELGERPPHPSHRGRRFVTLLLRRFTSR